MFPGHVALTHPDKPAVIMARTGKTITYAELDVSANKISRLLFDAGLRPGDNVAICLENHEKFFDVVWGCHYAGLIYTACSSRLTADELTYIVNDCGAKALITSAYLAPQIAVVADKIQIGRAHV